jgi:hypothetical protein
VTVDARDGELVLERTPSPPDDTTETESESETPAAA